MKASRFVRSKVITHHVALV